MCITSSKKRCGFTLLEMLVAIAIFTLLGLAANTVLHTVLKNDRVTAEFSDKLKALQQGFGMIERDFGQMVARTPRNFEGGRGNTVLQMGTGLFGSQSEAITFYRIGWLNPNGRLPRGSLQSVAYVLDDNKLERWYFPYPDQEVGTEPIKTTLFTKVLSVKYSFYSEGKWQKEIVAKRLPKAIAIELEFEGVGKIQRKFLLPFGPPVIKDNQTKADGSGKANEAPK